MHEISVTAAVMFNTANKFREAYYVTMQPLCEELDLPVAAVDILLFLANNEGYDTARDICHCRGMKPGIVSFHVEKLVNEGFLERQSVPGDRRKTRLVCTEKAAPVLERGRARQELFGRNMAEGLGEEDLAHLRKCMAVFERNIEQIRTGKAGNSEAENEQ